MKACIQVTKVKAIKTKSVYEFSNGYHGDLGRQTDEQTIRS